MTTMGTKVVPALAAICLLAASAQAQAQPVFDPADPVLLNEQAVRHAQQGNLRSARILLERAAVLAPHDATIARNLQLLGTALPGQMPLPPSGRPGQQAAQPAAVPPASRPGHDAAQPAALPPVSQSGQQAAPPAAVSILAPPPALWPPRQ